MEDISVLLKDKYTKFYYYKYCIRIIDIYYSKLKNKTK